MSFFIDPFKAMRCRPHGEKQMSDFETGSPALGRIHKASNDKKFFCYFTGFLEGILASGGIEVGEVEPLIVQCKDFVSNVSDGDAFDIVEDFDAELLAYESVMDIAEIRSDRIDQGCEKSAVNRFLGFCAGIACDDIITDREATSLIDLAASNPTVLNDIHVRTLVNTCIEALEDGIVEKHESVEICNVITRLVGDAYCDTGISSLGNIPALNTIRLDDADTQLDGKHLVLTGAFSISPRRLIEDELSARGAEVMKSVSRKTDYVVVATESSRDWIQTHKGTKLIKALELQDKHGRPDFIPEANLLRALGMR